MFKGNHGKTTRKDVPVGSKRLQLWIPTWHWKMSMFNGKYIFKRWMFHCHVNFRGRKTGVFLGPTLSPKAPSKKSSKSTEPSPPLSKSLKKDLSDWSLKDVEGPFWGVRLEGTIIVSWHQKLHLQTTITNQWIIPFNNDHPISKVVNNHA